ncbi:hypothetical protein JZ751_008294 [Albula glossodonta]|uniref:Uncharacterized protein n=1 Tax=Albula glossodonta TaxID=121402 RepID=A0A8T2N9F9_9TELE|nr:hypothetical protein JZ751_008294 [Albula glossodonta]
MFVEFNQTSDGSDDISLQLANHEPPRRQMVGATATVSTLATVVGQPNTPLHHRKRHNWERGLQPRFALLALNGLNESGFFPTDVCACPTHNKHIKVIA